MERGANQYEILNPKATGVPIHIIGAGSIGSWLALFLVKMGFTNVTVYDFDKIELHNADAQLYGERYVGVHKCTALKGICYQLGSLHHPITAVSEKVEKLSVPTGSVVVFAVDSITARKQIWENMKLNPPFWLIDGRMGGEEWQCLTVNTTNVTEVEAYSKTLHSVEESAQLPCGQKSILYVPAMLSTIMADNIKKIVMGQEIQRRMTYHALFNQFFFV